VKHCRKSYPGPECLDARLADQPEGNWNDFRNELWDCYCAVRDRLRDDHRGLCAYCEIDLADDNPNRQIAHFHPKGDKVSGHNWALDWANLWFACKGGTQTWMQDEDKYLPTISDNSSCDERKGGLILDGHILAPNEVPAFPRIFGYERGLDFIHSRKRSLSHDDKHKEETHRGRLTAGGDQQGIRAGEVYPPWASIHVAPVVGTATFGGGAGGDLRADGG
jgi:uncharacterized protein (TIGR02646 family)